jgi:hypothetical protein
VEHLKVTRSVICLPDCVCIQIALALPSLNRASAAAIAQQPHQELQRQGVRAHWSSRPIAAGKKFSCVLTLRSDAGGGAEAIRSNSNIPTMTLLCASAETRLFTARCKAFYSFK